MPETNVRILAQDRDAETADLADELRQLRKEVQRIEKAERPSRGPGWGPVVAAGASAGVASAAVAGIISAATRAREPKREARRDNAEERGARQHVGARNRDGLLETAIDVVVPYTSSLSALLASEWVAHRIPDDTAIDGLSRNMARLGGLAGAIIKLPGAQKRRGI